MKREGHKALVHTAAASNLGQMLNKICLEDGIPLVNIVRSAEQAKLLRGIGAKHVVDSTSANFTEELTQALVETGATIAFDAIGGGKLASQILTAMQLLPDIGRPGLEGGLGIAEAEGERPALLAARIGAAACRPQEGLGHLLADIEGASPAFQHIDAPRLDHSLNAPPVCPFMIEGQQRQQIGARGLGREQHAEEAVAVGIAH